MKGLYSAKPTHTERSRLTERDLIGNMKTEFWIRDKVFSEISCVSIVRAIDDSWNMIAWGNRGLVNSAAERFYDSIVIAADNSTWWQGYRTG
jgi:hypothetical protein